MNDEGLIFAGRTLDRQKYRYGCQRRVRIKERLEEREGRLWREMCKNDSEQAGVEGTCFIRRGTTTFGRSEGPVADSG